jgi:hypothetical protein
MTDPRFLPYHASYCTSAVMEFDEEQQGRAYCSHGRLNLAQEGAATVDVRRPAFRPEGSASQKEACRPKPARKTHGACTHEQRLVSVVLPAIGLEQGAFTRPLLPYGRLPTKKSCRSLEANAGASVCQRCFPDSLTDSRSGPTTSLEGRLHACANRLARLTCIQGKREMVQFPSPRNAGSK